MATHRDDDGKTVPERAAPARASSVVEHTVDRPDARAEPMENSLVSGSRIGRYTVLDQLGEGGMGVVYAAHDPELDRKVAIKILRVRHSSPGQFAAAQARLQREAQAMAQVSHPNVVAVHDVGIVGDQLFVAMELVEGTTLKSWLKEKNRPWREIVHAFLGAGEGLRAAHQAGLIHRDFKPDNVLMRKDGRPQVTDFGLARLVSENAPSEAPPRPGSSSDDSISSLLASPLTQNGVVMGTPHYMSPEQARGISPDSRSDQFSFCAALYWALYKKRPFEPAKLLGAALQLDEDGTPTQPLRSGRMPTSTSAARLKLFTQAVIQPPPRDAKVPLRIRRAVMRGLSLSPRMRFDSMEALLEELARDPWVLRRRVAAVAGVALLVGGTAVAYRSEIRRQSRLCAGAELKLAGAWDANVREQITRAFLASQKPFAQSAAAQVARQLDAYSSSWAAMHVDACQATRLRGEQTEHVLSLRMVCLDRRLKDLQALTSVLANADGTVVERAVDAAASLPPLSRCADVEALSSQVSPPDNAETRAALDRAHAQLSQVQALTAASKLKPALAVAQSAVESARKLQYKPLLGEALLWEGWVQDRDGNPKDGVRNLEESLRMAEAGRDDVTKTDSAIRLAYATGADQAKLELGQTWGRLAGAFLERVGGNDELEIDLENTLGSLALRGNDLADAERRYQAALAVLDRVKPPQPLKRSQVLGNLGLLYARKGDFDRALKAHSEALALIEKLKSPEHPSAGYAYFNIADVHVNRRDFPQAETYANKALAVWRASLGPDHPRVGDVLDMLATILQEEGRYADSMERYQQSLKLKEKTLGPEHPLVWYSLDGIGENLLKLGRAQEAVAPFERALKLCAQDPSNLPDTHFKLARALWSTPAARPRAKALAHQASVEFASAHKANESAQVTKWLAHPEAK